MPLRAAKSAAGPSSLRLALGSAIPPPRLVPPPPGPASRAPAPRARRPGSPGAARAQQPPPPARCAHPGRADRVPGESRAARGRRLPAGPQATPEPSPRRRRRRSARPPLPSRTRCGLPAAMRPSRTAGAALLVLLAAQFPARPALEEKKGKGVPAARAALPGTGPRPGRGGTCRCVSAPGEPAAAGGGDQGAGCGDRGAGCGDRDSPKRSQLSYFPALARGAAGVPARASQVPGPRDGRRECAPPLGDPGASPHCAVPPEPARGRVPSRGAAAAGPGGRVRVWVTDSRWLPGGDVVSSSVKSGERRPPSSLQVSRVPRARGVWCSGRFWGPPDVPPPRPCRPRSRL